MTGNGPINVPGGERQSTPTRLTEPASTNLVNGDFPRGRYALAFDMDGTQRFQLVSMDSSAAELLGPKRRTELGEGDIYEMIPYLMSNNKHVVGFDARGVHVGVQSNTMDIRIQEDAANGIGGVDVRQLVFTSHITSLHIPVINATDGQVFVTGLDVSATQHEDQVRGELWKLYGQDRIRGELQSVLGDILRDLNYDPGVASRAAFSLVGNKLVVTI